METTECKHPVIHNGVCQNCGKWQHAQTFHSGSYIDDRIKQLQLMYESAASRCRVAEHERDALKDAANDLYEYYDAFVQLSHHGALSPGERVNIAFRFGRAMRNLMRLVSQDSPDNASSEKAAIQ